MNNKIIDWFFRSH